jgi:hypothetical protein
MLRWSLHSVPFEWKVIGYKNHFKLTKIHKFSQQLFSYFADYQLATKPDKTEYVWGLMPARLSVLLRPLKLDDKVLVGVRMRFWPCIKKVCSSFLKKLRQNPCFLADDLASGHISGNPAYLSSRYCLPICACISVHVMVSGLYEYQFQTEFCSWAGASVWKSIHVSTDKNEKMKVDQIPSLLFKNWLTRTI